MDLQSRPCPRSCSLVGNQEASSSAAAPQMVSAALSRCLRSVSWRGEGAGPRSISHDSPITSARSPRSTFVFFQTCNSWTFVAFFCLYPSFLRNMSCSFGMVGTKVQRGAARIPGHRKILVVLTNLLCYCLLLHPVFCISGGHVVVVLNGVAFGTMSLLESIPATFCHCHWSPGSHL